MVPKPASIRHHNALRSSGTSPNFGLTDNRDDLAKVDIPTLILQCSEDIIACKEVGEFVHRGIPNSEIIILEATGHCPNLSAPDEVIAAMRKFV